MQIELIEDSVDSVSRPRTKDVAFGQTFRLLRNKRDILMRVKPVNFLLNSNILNDVINRGDVLVVNVQTGTCYIMRGDLFIEPVESTLRIS